MEHFQRLKALYSLMKNMHTHIQISGIKHTHTHTHTHTEHCMHAYAHL